MTPWQTVSTAFDIHSATLPDNPHHERHIVANVHRNHTRVYTSRLPSILPISHGFVKEQVPKGCPLTATGQLYSILAASYCDSATSMAKPDYAFWLGNVVAVVLVALVLGAFYTVFQTVMGFDAGEFQQTRSGI